MPVPNEPKPPVQGGENTAAEQQKKRDAQEGADGKPDAPRGK